MGAAPHANLANADGVGKPSTCPQTIQSSQDARMSSAPGLPWAANPLSSLTPGGRYILPPCGLFQKLSTEMFEPKLPLPASPHVGLNIDEQIRSSNA
jgi:hypothetical protein